MERYSAAYQDLVRELRDSVNEARDEIKQMVKRIFAGQAFAPIEVSSDTEPSPIEVSSDTEAFTPTRQTKQVKTPAHTSSLTEPSTPLRAGSEGISPVQSGKQTRSEALRKTTSFVAESSILSDNDGTSVSSKRGRSESEPESDPTFSKKSKGTTMAKVSQCAVLFVVRFNIKIRQSVLVATGSDIARSSPTPPTQEQTLLTASRRVTDALNAANAAALNSFSRPPTPANTALNRCSQGPDGVTRQAWQLRKGLT